MGVAALLQNRTALVGKMLFEKSAPLSAVCVCASRSGAVVVAVAHVVSECCVRASNFMKTNPLQNKRAKRSERPTHGLESGSDRGKKGEYISTASRVSISDSERGSWEIKAFNYMEEGRERVEARFVIEINSRPFYPKLSLLTRVLVRTGVAFPPANHLRRLYSYFFPRQSRKHDILRRPDKRKNVAVKV